jgi:hypothetical protein
MGQLLAAWTLVVAGGYFCLLNLVGLVGNIRGRKYSSAIPLIGGVILFAGLWQIPTVRSFAWAAFLLDWGTVCLVLSLPRLINEFWSTSRFRLVERYTCQSDTFNATLQLYQGEIWVLRRDYTRERGEYGMVSSSMTGHYKLEADSLVLELDEGSITLPSADGGWILSETPDGNSPAHPRPGIVLRRVL